MVTKVLLKDLKKGDFFITRPVDYPRESSVWIRGDYDRSCRRYSCYKFSDFCHEHFFRGDKYVYIDFEF